MKDYHDLLLMIREPDLLDLKVLATTIRNTFNHRGTVIRLPIAFNSSGIDDLQKLWTNHLRGLGAQKQKMKLPDTISDVLDELNAWILANNLQKKVETK